jgi:pyruvate dehydrogenase E2 component (dihydrolipoyllysine-residue acetyltransferase)
LKSATKTQVPLTRIQKLIGKRMLASKRTKPCFYIERKADVTELLGRRHKISKALGVKITSNTFLIRALALATRQYPLMLGRLVAENANGPLAEPVIQIPEGVNVGFAVNSPQGLVVPVIQNADRKTLAEIATEERTLTRKARSNKLTLEEIEGETIALSNLGAYGIDTFLGIVPLPAGTILAVGNPIRTVVPKDGHFLARKLMSLSIAVDHRVIHDDYAARFLSAVAERLRDFEGLM